MTFIELKERKVDGVTILTVEHGLKGEMESILKERIDQLVQEGSLQIVVDLKHVPYVDSRDIGRLIRSHLSVRQAGGRVRLCNLSGKVLDVLRMTRLDTVLDLYKSEAEALAAILGGKTQGRESAAAGPGRAVGRL
jgi:anti-sigma B factor antagonist